MTINNDLITAIDERIAEAIKTKLPGEIVLHLCEARAWLLHPDQAHGSQRSSQ
ncbi:MAG: hypothetical protein WCG18_00200 [Acidimicrobiaceae bacterium]|jgi:hypothetical protein